MGTHHQPFFLEQAAEDLVHHSAAWVVKQPGRSPIFVDCHAIEDPSLDRGWDLQVKVWQRNEIGLWASGEEIQQNGELGDALTARVSPKRSPARRVPSPKSPITSSRRSSASTTRTT